MPHLSGFRRSALLGRSNACLHHTGSFVAGIRGSGHDQCSIHLSYSGSPEGAALVGLEPTTFGADVTQALHHATNFSKDLLSLSHCFFAYLKNANTRSLGGQIAPLFTNLLTGNQSPGKNQRSRADGESNLQPYSLSRSNREPRHPGNLFPRPKLL